MSSPAANNIAGAPYRGTNWTQHGYSNAQQAYRYTSPLPQPAYTTYTASQQATPVSAMRIGLGGGGDGVDVNAIATQTKPFLIPFSMLHLMCECSREGEKHILSAGHRFDPISESI